MDILFDPIIERRNTKSLKWDFGEERFGRADIFPMWVADMDFKSAPEIIKTIINRANHGIFGYSDECNQLKNAMIKWFKNRYHWDIESSWIIQTPGVVTSINISILAFTNPGDKILIQTPVYYPFFSCVKNNDRQLVTNSLKITNNNVEIDFDDLEEKLSDNVKLMLLCSPHNPIGKVWSLEDLKKIVELCIKYNVLIISDEIHCDLVFKNFSHTPLLKINEEIKNNCITLISPTKTFNIAGLSMSSTIIPNKELKKKFISTMNKTGADMLNIFGIEAAITAYSECDYWVDRLLIYLEDNLNFLIDYFEKYIPKIKVIRPEATYLAWLDCTKLPVESNKLKDFFVNKAGIGMNDGIMFGIEGLGFQRLNFACPRDLLLTGLEKIRDAVDNL